MSIHIIPNYKQYYIDDLPMRTHCSKYKQYYHKAHNTTIKHIVSCDYYAKSKALTTHNLKPSTYTQALTSYVIVHSTIYTLDKLVKMLKHEHTKYIVHAKHEIIKGKEKSVNYISIDGIGTLRVYHTTRYRIEKILSTQY